MNKKYLNILSNLKEDDRLNQSQDDRILIIDGLNTFIRAFAVNPSQNDDGIHIGGMTGFLMSIGYAIKNIKPSRVIICFDGRGGSARRRKIFPDYKENRRVRQKLTRSTSLSTIEDERISMGQQIQRLTEYLGVLPVTTMATENIEADDAIAYITEQVYPKSNCIIMSTDKDFLQLVSKRVQVWSPTKKRFYFPETILEEYGIPVHNFLMFRMLKGDGSDNIPGVRGTGIKTLQRRLPILFEDKTISVDDVIEYAKNSKDNTKLSKTISESEELLNMNHRLMQLQDVDIDGTSKSSILNIVREPISRLVKYKFQKMMLEDKLNTAIKNPDLWLKQVFSHLEAMAEKGNNE